MSVDDIVCTTAMRLKWQKKMSNRLVRSPDTLCYSPTRPSRQHRLWAVKEMSQKVRLFSSGRAKKTDSSNIPARHPFQGVFYRVSKVSTCSRPSAGVQDHMSNWMSSLIQAQDGCLQMVAQRVYYGQSPTRAAGTYRCAREQRWPSPSDQVSYLCAQLAHREAQLEQVRAERDKRFVQEEEEDEVLAHMRLLSSEAKDWKSRVVTEAEECCCVWWKCSSCTTSYRSSRGHGSTL